MTLKSINTIQQRLIESGGEGVDLTIYADKERQAAVLMAFTREADPKLVLTRRALTLSSHAGEVAFPGGKCDPEDGNLTATALREAHEEIGVPAERVRVLGAMSTAHSKFGVPVTPVIGLIEPDEVFVPNPHELDHIFMVPLSYLHRERPTHIHRGEYNGVKFEAPCYNFEGNIIWGLTAYFVVEFMNQVFDLGIDIQIRIEK